MPTVLFLSESCLLDRKSGAAHSARAMLQALARAGWQAHAATLSLFDGDQAYPIAQTHPELDPAHCAGTAVTVSDDGLTHEVYVCSSTRQQALRPWELRAYLGMAEQVLERLQPDVVLTYSSPSLLPLLAQAQQRGARTVFYVANPAYAKREGFEFRFIDAFVTPSQAMVALYQEKLGIQAQLLRDLVTAPLDGRINLGVERRAARQQRYVTMVNPEPAKGGLFFINLAVQAKALAPTLKFRAVESRWGRADWQARGVDEQTLDAIEWHPRTDNMDRIFNDSALLLVPSLGFEASARVVAESLLAGVPVLAMRSGGIEEQLNGGGFLFEVPAAMQNQFLAPPDKKDLHQWLQFIRVLMTDDAIYASAVNLALKASELHRREIAEAAVVATFEAIADKPVLSGMGGDETSKYRLAAQRERMNSAREAVNAQLEARQPAGLSAAQEPYLNVLKISLAQPAIRDAMQATKAGDLDRARAILEQYLRLLPEDITALGLLADVASKQERDAEARRLMERVVALAPGFAHGQQQLLRNLRHAGDAVAGLKHSFALIERAPHQPRYLALHASLLTTANRFDDAIAVYAAFFRQHKGGPHDWMQYALALKTVGEQERAVDAYRQAIALAPGHGAAWHALSNMKLAVFTPQDIASMTQQLQREDLSPEDRFNIHFTLGKAHEDQKAYAPSFENYALANGIRCSQSDYDVGRLEAYVAEAKATFTAEFFAARKGQGNPAQDPVFVLGLHRAGSTLTEQILASHSQIEGTRELPDLLRIGRDFGGMGPKGQERGLNVAMLQDLSAQELAMLGQTYLDTSREARHTQRPLFVDKMPANWMYTGLIHLMLPNAKIIDIRRQPMAAGFALFKMNFGRGVDHSYNQKDIARYYRAYADLMAHFDTVLPGRVHRIQYENLVENTEAEIRRLVAYCGLPFEPSCLRYWETERAVQTPSSEQVRQPIYKGSVDVWTHYAEWLGPMREAFGELA